MKASYVKTQLPLVSVLILNVNGLSHLDTCLKSVMVTDYPNLEIILVDNGSTDRSVDYVAKNYPNVKIITNGKNLGFAAGNNVGIKKTKGDYEL